MKRMLICIIALFVLLNATAVSSHAIVDESKNIQDVIVTYYDKSYDSWLDLQYYDLSDVLDENSVQSYNKITYLKDCILRWELIIKDGYVDNREKLNIVYDFKSINITGQNTATVVVNIEGDVVETYPYFVCFGSNLFTLTKVDGAWKITDHMAEYLSLSEYPSDNKVEYKPERIIEEMNAAKSVSVSKNEEIFDSNSTRAYPYTSYSYNASRAVAYANEFCSGANNYNRYFYYPASDCTNFVSQCVSYGFGTTTQYNLASSYRMRNNGDATTGWFAGAGGGSSPWENVTNHWNYMISPKTNMDGPRVAQITYSSLGIGDVMQIDHTNDGKYDHSTICVDATSQKFAQHTSNLFRYYADYSGTKRFYRPTSFRVY